MKLLLIPILAVLVSAAEGAAITQDTASSGSGTPQAGGTDPIRPLSMFMKGEDIWSAGFNRQGSMKLSISAEWQSISEERAAPGHVPWDWTRPSTSKPKLPARDGSVIPSQGTLVVFAVGSVLCSGRRRASAS